MKCLGELERDWACYPSLAARMVEPLLATYWEQWNAVEVVVLGGQGAVPGKNY